MIVGQLFCQDYVKNLTGLDLNLELLLIWTISWNYRIEMYTYYGCWKPDWRPQF